MAVYVGQRYGGLCVVESLSKRVRCRCECGEEAIRYRSALERGHRLACDGCLSVTRPLDERRRELAERNYEWSLRIVARYWRRSPQFEDEIRSEAGVGLVHAALNYRGDLGLADDVLDEEFRCFASCHVLGRVKNLFVKLIRRDARALMDRIDLVDPGSGLSLAATLVDPSTGTGPQRLILRDEAAALLDRLDDEEARVLLLHYAEERTVVEIARGLGRSRKWVYARLADALRKLSASPTPRSGGATRRDPAGPGDPRPATGRNETPPGPSPRPSASGPSEPAMSPPRPAPRRGTGAGRSTRPATRGVAYFNPMVLG